MNRVLVGHVLDQLATLADASVDCCPSSPPYWGLRDYQTEPILWPAVRYSPMPGLPEIEIPEMVCSLGLESAPEAFVGHMVAVYREVFRVLKLTGTVWVNLGDSYAIGAGKVRTRPGGGARGDRWSQRHAFFGGDGVKGVGPMTQPNRLPIKGLKPKDMVGIPWRVAFALQADGWYLRQDVVWNKPNPMPESVTDRCTKAHEYVFLLAKSERYFYNPEAIKEKASGTAHSRGEGVNPKARNVSASSHFRVTHAVNARPPKPKQNESFSAAVRGLTEYRNKRSVWAIPTQSYPQAHFATFPEELPRTCILAGCPEGGVVLDMFAGSGTTLAVAKALGRKYVGIELNPDYAKLIDQRLSAVTPPFDFSEAA